MAHAEAGKALLWMQVEGLYDVKAGTVSTAAGEERSLQAFISQLKGKRIPQSPASVIMVTGGRLAQHAVVEASACR